MRYEIAWHNEVNPNYWFTSNKLMLKEQELEDLLKTYNTNFEISEDNQFLLSLLESKGNKPFVPDSHYSKVPLYKNIIKSAPIEEFSFYQGFKYHYIFEKHDTDKELHKLNTDNAPMLINYINNLYEHQIKTWMTKDLYFYRLQYISEVYKSKKSQDDDEILINRSEYLKEI